MKALAVGDTFRYEDAGWRVIDTDGVHLVLKQLGGEEVARVSSHSVLSSDTYEPVTRALLPLLADARMLDGLTTDQKNLVEFWFPHIMEILTGKARTVTGGNLYPELRPEFAPDVPLKLKVALKADELKSAGALFPVSKRTVYRKIAGFKEFGLSGLLDGRSVTSSQRWGRADDKLVNLFEKAVAGETYRSTGTKSRLINDVTREALKRGIKLPSRSTMYRLADRAAADAYTFDNATTRRSKKLSPERAWEPIGVTQPGELVELDSTPLDLYVLMPDGTPARMQLSIAVDVTTRSILSAILAPTAQSVDIVLLLTRALISRNDQPGWTDNVERVRDSLPVGVIPTSDVVEQLVEDTPIVYPQTITVDRGKAYDSRTLMDACATLGISLNQASPYTPTDKPHVERTFRSIRTMFVQYLTGYVGNNVQQRGTDLQLENLLTLEEATILLDLWIMSEWQHHRVDGLSSPITPKRDLSPNEAFAILENVFPQPKIQLTSDDYISLLPREERAIANAQISLHGLKYRHQDLYHLTPDGRVKVEVRSDPNDIRRIYVRHPKTGEWIHVPCVHNFTHPVSKAVSDAARSIAPRNDNDTVSIWEYQDAVEAIWDGRVKKQVGRKAQARDGAVKTGAEAVTTLKSVDTPETIYTPGVNSVTGDDDEGFDVLPLVGEDEGDMK